MKTVCLFLSQKYRKSGTKFVSKLYVGQKYKFYYVYGLYLNNYQIYVEKYKFWIIIM